MSAQSVTVTDEQIHAAQGGDQLAMWEIVEAYESFLAGIVRSVAPKANRDDAEDLLQEARAVLIQHIREYKTGSSAAQLSTFAYRAVRRAVAEEYVRATVGTSVEPSAALRVRQALWTTDGDVEGAWMLVSYDADPRKRMGHATFLAVVEALADVVSFDAPVQGDDGLTLAETLPESSSDFTGEAERRNLARWLMTQVAPRQSYALRAFYGVGMERAQDADVAAHLGATPARVRVLRNEGTTRARVIASAHGIAA